MGICLVILHQEEPCVQNSVYGYKCIVLGEEFPQILKVGHDSKRG